MKKIFSILITTSLLLANTACTDWLDIRPESETVLEDYWQNESQANQVVAACYRSLTEEACMRRMILWGELRSDNITYGSSLPTEIYKILNVDISASNSYASWASMYQVINYCNTFLLYAPNVIKSDANFTESELKTLQAEVMTIRALTYFYLVRTFKEVPLITDPSIDDTQNYSVAKSSEREILDYLITDLKKAEIFARDDYSEEAYPKARVTKSAVRALLADIYLWDQQYEQSVNECNKILADKTLKLVEADEMYRSVFYTGGSSESIFELAFSDADEWTNKAVRSLYGYSGDVSGQLSFSSFLVKGDYSPFNFKVSTTVESAKDVRLNYFINQNLGKSLGYYYIFKYAGSQCYATDLGGISYYYTNLSPSWIVYRLSDVMLMRAEALVQLNRSEDDLKEALKMVNTTYLRANPDLNDDSLDFQTYSSPLVLEKLVLRERQRELMFEGKRWFDLMRIARRNDSPTGLLDYILPKFTGSSSLQYNKMSVMNALYFPIYQAELDANPNLTQNPFYDITGSSSVTN